MLAADCAGDRIFVPNLIIFPVLLPHYHRRTRTFLGSLHVQHESSGLAGDHEILAFDAHSCTSTPREVRLPDCNANARTCATGLYTASQT